jgi:negative regulator of sigma E activity
MAATTGANHRCRAISTIEAQPRRMIMFETHSFLTLRELLATPTAVGAVAAVVFAVLGSLALAQQDKY